MTRSTLRCATNDAGANPFRAIEGDEPGGRHHVAEPARPVRGEERGEGRERDGHRGDGDRHVESQLGPAVGVLVELESERGTREDEDGHRDEHDARDHVPPASPCDRAFQPDDDPARESSGGDQLEVAAPGVVAVRHPGGRHGVESTEQVGDLESDEEADHEIDPDEHDERLGGA